MMTHDQICHALGLDDSQPQRPQMGGHGRCSTERGKAAQPQRVPAAQNLNSQRRRLRRLEDALIEALLEHHCNSDDALDRLLNDVQAAASSGSRGSHSAPIKPLNWDLFEQRIISILLEKHPRRDSALARLESDLGLSPAPKPVPARSRDDWQEDQQQEAERWSGLE